MLSRKHLLSELARFEVRKSYKADTTYRIIRERRRQANFQLIVITHDEGFLQRLAGHDVLEYYWYVTFPGTDL